MGQRGWWLGVLVLLLVSVPARGAEPLTESLAAALDARALRGATVGALVVRRDDGEVLFARSADRAMVPASNHKVLTTLAALETFGPTRTFPVEVGADTPPDARGEVGMLVFRSTGNPALTSEDFWRLAADLRLAGVTRARDGLWIDAGAFDSERWHPNWGAVSSRAYHAPVSAFSVNYGSFALAVEPGRAAGEPVRAHLDPPVPSLVLVNRAVTGAARSALTLQVDRSASEAGEKVTVSGSIPAGGKPKTYYRSVAEPERYAAAVLRMQLAALGIDVGPTTRFAAAPPDFEPFLVFDGPALAEIVRRCLKYSNNVIAESLVKLLGANAGGGPGSWATGVPALRASLARLGVPGDGLVVVDGSGLSYDDRVSPRQLVAALRAADASFAFGTEFAAGLPVAARDGTLEKRADGAADAVRAKTGLLTRITGLSGYARLADGTEVVFSLLVNAYRSSDDRAMGAVDDFVAALVAASAPLAAESRPPPAGATTDADPAASTP